MPEVVKTSLAALTFACPYCGHQHALPGTGHSYPVTFDCPGENCFYSFVIHPQGAFSNKSEAEKHSRNKLPTVGPRHTFLRQGHWILAHQYRQVTPHNVVRLTQFISEDTVKALLHGFSHALSSNVTVLEPRDNDFQRIDPGDPELYAREFCSLVHAKGGGTVQCHKSIRDVVASRWGSKKPYFEACWMGLQKFFVPILVEGRVIGVFVCGDMQTTRLREKQVRQIRKGIREAAELGVNVSILEKAAGIGIAEEDSRTLLHGLFGRTSLGASQLSVTSRLAWRDEHEHRAREQDVASRARMLENLAEQAYHAQRRHVDGRFINEIGALFNTPHYLDEVKVPQRNSRRDNLWRMLSHVLRRIADFLEIEEAHYFVAEVHDTSEGSRLLFVPKASSTPAFPPGALSTDLFKPILADKENRFWPTDESGADPVNILAEALKGWLNKTPTSLVFCPMVPREDGESCLVLVNRNDPARGFSASFRRCVRNVAREVSHDVNHALRTIRLEAEQDRLRDYIENTFHTLNQSMYDINMAMEFLNLRTTRNGFSQKAVHKAVNRMRAAVTELDARTNLLYSYVSHRQPDYQFDMPFSLEELVRECADKFEAAARPREIVIQTALDLRDDQVCWDRFHMDVLMTNLIHNAIKYSHRHKDIIVQVREAVSPPAVEISVSNFGHGIPSEETQKIFQRGFRSSVKDSSRPIPGTGLGLFMTSEVVRNHHGEIRASSVRDGRPHSIKENIKWEGFHTTFAVIIPRRVT
jgi:signal transduction histidine kinase/ligand-binding sensor protein